jgi:hypothetical protein
MDKVFPQGFYITTDLDDEERSSALDELASAASRVALEGFPPGDLPQVSAEANDTAIDLLVAAGYGPDGLDDFNHPLTEHTQTLLATVLMRNRALMEMVSRLANQELTKFQHSVQPAPKPASPEATVPDVVEYVVVKRSVVVEMRYPVSEYKCAPGGSEPVQGQPTRQMTHDEIRAWESKKVGYDAWMAVEGLVQYAQEEAITHGVEVDFTLGLNQSTDV